MKECEDPEKRKKALAEERKSNFNCKKLYSVFFKGTTNVREENKSWLWLKDGYLKKKTEGLIIAAQDQTIRTKWIKRLIGKYISQYYRCGDADKTVSHIVAECKLIAQKDYKISIKT